MRPLTPIAALAAFAASVALSDESAHRADYLRFRSECRRGAFVLGQATSMENVRPRSGFHWRRADEVEVRLARCEYESVQILVAPAECDLKDVRVDVTMDDDGGFSSTNIMSCVVGYVETTNTPPYWVRPTRKPPALGWWPDPILDFQCEADISGEDVQSFWVRVRCPEDQSAGTYAGRISVSATGESPVSLPFRVRVYDFAVGRTSPLPIAVTCIKPSVGASALGGDRNMAQRIRESGYHKAWKEKEERYCDFFADYYMTRDSLYVNGRNEPRWDMLKRLKAQGRLGMFNLCYWWYMGNGEEGERKWREGPLKIFRGRYEKAKALGLEKHAYFYGCDEQNPPTFARIARTVTALHKEFPGVPIMTTARDKKLGTGNSPLKDIDIHCPALCFWDNVPVREAQREGRQVWWYFCNDPASPWANTTLEGPPSEIRSLMGAQTQKFKPDGFLYYSTMNWTSEKPITKGPFTAWNPRSIGKYHGDGQWTCCGGPENMPLATIRLENFRDGLEDLWYVRELERRLAAHEDRNGQWAMAARKMLAVPDEVAKSVKDFATDPSVIYRWRDGIADLIESYREFLGTGPEKTSF